MVRETRDDGEIDVSQVTKRKALGCAISSSCIINQLLCEHYVTVPENANSVKVELFKSVSNHENQLILMMLQKCTYKILMDQMDLSGRAS